VTNIKFVSQHTYDIIQSLFTLLHLQITYSFLITLFLTFNYGRLWENIKLSLFM